MDYFKYKYYLTKDSERVAHVHIIGDKYTVCGHYKRFTEFKRRTFDKTGFEEFVNNNDLDVEMNKESKLMKSVMVILLDNKNITELI